MPYLDVTKGLSTHPAYNWLDYEMPNSPQIGRVVWESDGGSTIFHKVPRTKEEFRTMKGCAYDHGLGGYFQVITIEFPEDNWDMLEAKEFLKTYGGVM